MQRSQRSWLTNFYILLLVAVPGFAHAQAPLPWLHQEGVYWKDEDGRRVDLKGVNLGNWLLLEMWMTQLFDNVSDQCGLENELTNRFGYAGKESIMRTWRDNWITERDLDLCQSLGFNCVRVPFLYSIIEDENNPYTVRPDAWDHLDWVIDEAEERGMYTILDLHGAVGGQSGDHTTGCANQNLLWSTPSYQDRTEWLWEQIATRYQNRSAVAAYDLLNEAWGTDCNTMANFQIDLYNAIRPIDQNHIVILSAAITCGGIDMYGDPQDDHGMYNVAFTHHFYPGFFGNGDATVDTHADWLACRLGNGSGICEWVNKMVNTGTAFLVGEYQPWATLGDDGGELARHTFDRYAELGMAQTAWAYKVLSENGGQGQGTWGMVTNVGQPGVSASTWTCAGWDSTFSQACGNRTLQYVAPGSGTYTLYVVLKNGALNTNTFNVTWDEISFVHDASGQELLTNGSFGSPAGWTLYTHESPVNFNFSFGGTGPAAGSGAALRMWGTAPSFSIANGGVYQAVTVVGGETYTLSGAFRDQGSNDTWAEVYLVDTQPVNGVDVVNPGRLPDININTWSQAAIESYLQTLSNMEYEIHPGLLYWLTTAQQPCLIAELCDPVCGDGNCESGEDACYCPGDCAGVCPPGQPYFGTPHSIPGRIEAEDFDQGGSGDAYQDCDGSNNGGAYRPGEGVDIEASSEGGYNVGWVCEGEWIEYAVDVTWPGIYDVEVRVASQSSGGAFQVEFDYANNTGQICVPETGGWQTWTTVSGSVYLHAGVQQMRFIHGGLPGQEYNLGYFDLTLRPPAGDLDGDDDVDADDLNGLLVCMEGPGLLPDPVPPPPTDEECLSAFDFDVDSDADLHDLVEFQTRFTGP